MTYRKQQSNRINLIKMKNIKKSFKSFEFFNSKYKSKSIKIDIVNYPNLGFVRFWIFTPLAFAITFKIYN